MLSKLFSTPFLKKRFSASIKSRLSQPYHREVSHFKKPNKKTKPNHFIGNHRVLDHTESIKPTTKTSRKLWKQNKPKETENEFDKISFSHRAVTMRSENYGFCAIREREKQMEINRLTNYYAPKVHKLNPVQISESIKMRSKLAKLLPKKDLQPKLYPKSSFLMQKHLHPIKACDNYKKQYDLDKILDKKKQITSTRESLKTSKQRSVDRLRLTWARTLENTPWSKSGFMEQALKMVKRKQGMNKEIMSPLQNLIRYAKNLARSVKSKEP